MRRQLWEAYAWFVAAYRDAAAKLRAGDLDPPFPPVSRLRKHGVMWSIIALLCFLVPDASASTDEGKARRRDRSQAARLSSTIERIERSLRVRDDGTVTFVVRKPAYNKLRPGERLLGQNLIDLLNARVLRGEVQLDQELRAFSPKSVSCDTEWWGETCNIDPATTQQIYEALEAGDAALTICDLIPVADAICEAIEIVGAIPFELEPDGCVDSNDGSVFHVTWVGDP